MATAIMNPLKLRYLQKIRFISIYRGGTQQDSTSLQAVSGARVEGVIFFSGEATDKLPMFQSNSTPPTYT